VCVAVLAHIAGVPEGSVVELHWATSLWVEANEEGEGRLCELKTRGKNLTKCLH